ncbi:hypothetical protein [Bacillus marasmi]|uniref:hypothetical protein n=1 Tax=Bacillus marasmi TaxID=1926279 RepID=UPI0011C9518D|nr:hypothetical protein [Bacillus marasmi]
MWRNLEKQKIPVHVWKLLMYVMAVFSNSLLYKLSEKFGFEWIFASLTLGLFALFVRVWRRFTTSGFGLVFLTTLGLFMVNSIFYLLMPPVFTISFSLLFGIVLFPFFRDNRYAVLMSWWVVIFNVLMNFRVPNELLFWLTFLTSGIGALIGFYQGAVLFKRFFTVIFSFSAGGYLLIILISKAYLNSLFVLLAVGAFAVVAYLFNQRAR